MLITYKELRHVEFPVFPLPSDDWYSQDKILFVEGQIVDDKNQPGRTLGQRRLQTPLKGLMRLNKAAYNELAIIKQGKHFYIDNLGRCFVYEKTKFVKLKYSRIKRIDRKEKVSILWVWGISFPFIIPRPPSVGYKWAGILYLDNNPWLLYDYSEEKQKDTRRKI